MTGGATPPQGVNRLGRLAARGATHVTYLAKEATDQARFALPPANPAPSWTAEQRGMLVYDFGANRGANLPYYLRQGFRVVAVEANPSLAHALSTRYAGDPRVTVVGACLAPEARPAVPFWVHRQIDKVSTMIRPEDPDAFDQILVDTVTPAALFAAHGDPYYVKIDLEGADTAILRAVLPEGGQRVPYLSVEVHDPEPIAWLMAAGYTQFKLVEGRYAHLPYYRLPATDSAPAYAFPQGESAGPFGEDIPGPWHSAPALFATLRDAGLGWKDVHVRG